MLVEEDAGQRTMLAGRTSAGCAEAKAVTAISATADSMLVERRTPLHELAV
jgi:hypothetical protein